MKDPEIIRLQANQQFLRKKAFESQSDSDMGNYRNTRNLLKRTIRNLKRKFYKTALSSNKSKLVWKTIHRILKPNHKVISASPNDLNDYYADLAENLTGSKSAHATKTNEPDDEASHHFIKLTNYNVVHKELTRLRNDCSTGFDSIPAKFIKPVADHLASPLTHIINNCIKKRIFPKQWKIAKICPVPKIQSPTKSSDYRPISILPILSKIFERIILNQLKSSFESHQVLRDTQSGYRPGHSCITLLHKLCNDISLSLRKGEVTLAVMVDYSKAFDTVNYEILVSKLQELKFSNSLIDLLIDYLSDREQFVQINDKRSKKKKLMCGVPQGSILGPMLFNIYVYDLANYATSSTIQFADDSTFYQSCKVNKIDDTAGRLATDIMSIEKWSKDSHLVFNAKKTKSMLFSSQRMAKLHNLDQKKDLIRCENTTLERVSSAKLLGLHIQQDLHWDTHVNETLKSGYSTLKTLKQIKRLTNFRLRKTLAESLILQRVDYGASVYGNGLQGFNKKRVQKLLNCSAGYVRQSFSTPKDCVNLKWLPFEENVAFSSVKLASKAIHEQSWPKYLKVRMKTPSRILRNYENDLHSISPDSPFTELMSKHYNGLPLNLRETQKSNNDLKKYFLDIAFSRLTS